jgi:hypothetical protein
VIELTDVESVPALSSYSIYYVNLNNRKFEKSLANKHMKTQIQCLFPISDLPVVQNAVKIVCIRIKPYALPTRLYNVYPDHHHAMSDTGHYCPTWKHYNQEIHLLLYNIHRLLNKFTPFAKPVLLKN